MDPFYKEYPKILLDATLVVQEDWSPKVIRDMQETRITFAETPAMIKQMTGLNRLEFADKYPSDCKR